MRRREVIFILIALVSANFASASNRIGRFSIHQCQGRDCTTASSNEAFVNYTGRMISADHVRLEVRKAGKTQLFRCDNFMADLISARYVCDNRESGRASVTVDSDLNLRRFE